MQYQALPVVDAPAEPTRTMHARYVDLSAKRGEADGSISARSAGLPFAARR